MNNKELFGQYFTPTNIVQQMITLIKNNGSILEPSCGDGAFLTPLLSRDIIGLEIDSTIAHPAAIIMDFFDYQKKHDTIIGNPPYVRFQEIYSETQQKLPIDKYDKRTNLYVFFIDRCIDLLNDNGELIFIVPRDFIKTTSAIPLNTRLYHEGGFTYWEEFGDTKIFKDASPNVVIFRWVKGMKHNIPVEYNNGFLAFPKENNSYECIPMSELFTICVGGASGANDIFISNHGNIDLVTSETCRTGLTKKAHYYNSASEAEPLLPYKNQLLERKIKNFSEKNWWEWGRKIRHINGTKIYVNNKTRDAKPFYTHDSGWYDGSVLALVPMTNNPYSIETLIKMLNENNWEEQGFKVGGRLIFGQRSLTSAYLQKNKEEA